MARQRGPPSRRGTGFSAARHGFAMDCSIAIPGGRGVIVASEVISC